MSGMSAIRLLLTVSCTLLHLLVSGQGTEENANKIETLDVLVKKICHDTFIRESASQEASMNTLTAAVEAVQREVAEIRTMGDNECRKECRAAKHNFRSQKQFLKNELENTQAKIEACTRHNAEQDGRITRNENYRSTGARSNFSRSSGPLGERGPIGPVGPQDASPKLLISEYNNGLRLYDTSRPRSNATAVLTPGSNFSRCVAYDAISNTVYFDDKKKNIISINVETKETQKVVTVDRLLFTLAVDGPTKKIFWSDLGDDIYRVNFDGSHKRSIATGERHAYLAVHSSSQKLYWGTRSTIKRSDFDGDGSQIFIENSIRKGGITIDNVENVIYWTYDCNTVAKAPLSDPSSITIFTTGIPSVRGNSWPMMATDDEWIYITERSMTKVYRAKKNNGTDLEIFKDNVYTMGLDVIR